MTLLNPALQKLWNGEWPLKEAFWRFLITYGLLINLGATLLALTLYLAGAPIWLAAITHLLPLPYSILAVTGVWRSAAAPNEDRVFAQFARFASLAWLAIMLIF